MIEYVISKLIESGINAMQLYASTPLVMRIARLEGFKDDISYTIIPLIFGFIFLASLPTPHDDLKKRLDKLEERVK